MLISLNWLKKYVDVPKGYSPEDLGLKMTMATVEIEGVKEQGQNLDGVVVGEILGIKKHPNADKLSLAQVDVGEGEPRQIIFGQMVKMEVGFKVPVALAPTVLPAGREVKKTKFRGEPSEGMLCLDQELELLQEGVSIHFFDQEVKNGTPIVEALNLNDTILEIDNKSITHRPDLWGHYGLARELAAILKVKLKDLELKDIKEGRKVKLKVEIKDKEACRRYIGVVMDGIKVGPSPEWLTRQLESVGVRSINNIVDLTNYVMLELGQPMHAFDLRNIDGNKIVVAKAKKGEKFITLDGQERELTDEDLMINDVKKSVALAGVMGGENSEIQDDTTTMLIESANFDAVTIRKTSQRLGLRTEGSARWEKSLDPFNAEIAMKRAVNLILEIIPGAKVVSKVIDKNYYEFTAPEIELDLDWLNKRVGMTIKKEEVIDILERLNFEVKDKKESLIVKVPSFRATRDISIAEDLVEEVARIYGYDNIKPSMPLIPIDPPQVNQQRQAERKIKQIFILGLGYTEVYNYSFVNLEKMSLFGLEPKDHIKLKNYLSEDQNALRTSLIPNLANNLIDNQRFFTDFRIFEIGRVFRKEKGKYDKGIGSKDKLPYQEKYLAGVVTEKENSQPIYLVKGTLENLFNQLNLDYYFKETKENVPSYADSQRVLKVVVKGQDLGFLGDLDLQLLNKLDIQNQVGFFEINFSRLASLVEDYQEYKQIPKFPGVLRDLSIIVDQKITWAEIKKAVKKTGDELVREVELFDVYQGGKIDLGKKSLAFHILYQTEDRTLEAEEVNKVEKKIIDDLEKKLGAKIR